MAGRTVPTLEIEAPSGRRVTVAPTSCDDHLGVLADALGLDPTRPLRVDGRPVRRHDSLVRAGVRRGSRLVACDEDADVPATSGDAALVVVTGDGGPAAGTAVALGPGC